MPARNTARNNTPRPAETLQQSFAAVRVSFTWLGTRKTLSASQKDTAAEPFGADGHYLSASKKLFNTKDKSFRALTRLKTEISSYWKSNSLPYPEPGLRLIKQEDIEKFNATLSDLQTRLVVAERELNDKLPAIKAEAQAALGDLYDPGEYPTAIRGLFNVDWEFPNVSPPDYLLKLNPALYQAEQRRIAARFDEAVRLAEEAFTAEFAKLVQHLTERLTGAPAAGKDRKIFRDTAVDNLTEFFDRFKRLNVRSNPELERLIESAKGAIKGTKAEDLRESPALRTQISAQLTEVQRSVEALLVNAPRRRILRNLTPGKAA
jgi:hypothetical protein